MKIKTCPAQVKSGGPSTIDDGQFEAIVSVFGNIDYVGDVVEPGAFAGTIAEWKASGDPLPVLWSHRTDNPMYNIGAVLDIAELSANDPRVPDWADANVKANGGLWVKGQLDTGDGASPIAVQARRLLTSRRVTQFSYAYDVLDGGSTVVDGVDAYALRRLKLHEVSPTQIGCNDQTELIRAKSLLDLVEVPADPAARAVLLKVGRVLSARNETNIRQAVGLLTDTLAAIDGSDGSDGEPAKRREEPHGAKRREELAPLDATSFRAFNDLTTSVVESGRNT